MKKNICVFTVLLMTQFIAKGAEAEVKSADEMLNKGIMMNNTQMMDQAITAGANVDSVSHNAIWSIFAIGNHLALMKLLFYGYSPYKDDEWGKNLFKWNKDSFTWTSMGNDQQNRRELTRSYIDSYEKNTKNIMEYIQGNNINNLVKLISNQPYLLNSPYNYGNALYFTILHDKPELFKLLLKLGANPNYSFKSQSGKKWENINQYLSSDNFKNNKEIRDKEIFKTYLTKFTNITNSTTQVRDRVEGYFKSLEAKKHLPTHLPIPGVADIVCEYLI